VSGMYINRHVLLFLVLLKMICVSGALTFDMGLPVEHGVGSLPRYLARHRAFYTFTASKHKTEESNKYQVPFARNAGKSSYLKGHQRVLSNRKQQRGHIVQKSNRKKRVQENSKHK